MKKILVVDDIQTRHDAVKKLLTIRALYWFCEQHSELFVAVPEHCAYREVFSFDVYWDKRTYDKKTAKNNYYHPGGHYLKDTKSFTLAEVDLVTDMENENER